MATKLRLADMAEQQQTHEFTFTEGLEYLDSVPGLIRHEINDMILWVGEGCDTQHWIAFYDSMRLRIVTEVRFTTHVCGHSPRIETSAARTVHTLAELDEMVKNALLQLSKARKEFAEITRIQRKAEVRNAAREYEV